VKAAWDDASEQMESLGDPESMFDHLLAERPAYLEEQRQAMKSGRGDQHG